MARVFITGSSDGLGLMAARVLIEQGHEVVVHGRNEGRSRDAVTAAAGTRGAVTGDLSTIAGARTVADQVNKLGRFDAVIHNAGIGYRAPRRMEADPRVPIIFAVNVLAAYILTVLIDRPGRLVYVSSGTHHGVRPRMDDLLWAKRAWSGFSAYAESKLCDVLLAFAVARRWKDVRSNALELAGCRRRWAALRPPTISIKAASPRRGSRRAKTSWRDRPAGISIINGRVRRIGLRAMSTSRMSCSRSAAASPVFL